MIQLTDEQSREVVHAAMRQIGTLGVGGYVSESYFQSVKPELDAIVADLHTLLALRLMPRYPVHDAGQQYAGAIESLRLAKGGN